MLLMTSLLVSIGLELYVDFLTNVLTIIFHQVYFRLGLGGSNTTTVTGHSCIHQNLEESRGLPKQLNGD